MNGIKYNYLFWTVLSFIYTKLQKPTSFTLGPLQYYRFTKKKVEHRKIIENLNLAFGHKSIGIREIGIDVLVKICKKTSFLL